MAIRVPRECGELIERQSGVLARWQAAECAMRLSGIDTLLRRGRWQTLYRGVYGAYTGQPSRESMLWAAVRRCGPGAALSHFTAAELDCLADHQSHAIHMVIAGELRIRISDAEYASGLPRIVLHRSARIDAARHPARTPPRTRIEETVLDLTQLACTFDTAFSWLSTACSRRLSTPDLICAAAGRRAKLRWRAGILGALAEIDDGVCSYLEHSYITSVERAHGLPRADRQTKIVGGPRAAYLDNLYSRFGLAVELDGRAAHPAEARWHDIHRDNFLASSGIDTLRYGWADVTSRPCQVARQIALVLELRGWTGTLRSCGPSCQASR